MAITVAKVVPVAIVLAFALAQLLRTLYYWRSARNSLSSGANGVIEFDYSKLARATKRFSKDALLGKGNFGEVYKATWNGQEVVVKKMKAEGMIALLEKRL
jgi:hypothetical protein